MSTNTPDRNRFLSGVFLPAYGGHPHLGREGCQSSRTP